MGLNAIIFTECLFTFQNSFASGTWNQSGANNWETARLDTLALISLRYTLSNYRRPLPKLTLHIRYTFALNLLLNLFFVATIIIVVFSNFFGMLLNKTSRWCNLIFTPSCHDTHLLLCCKLYTRVDFFRSSFFNEGLFFFVFF